MVDPKQIVYIRWNDAIQHDEVQDDSVPAPAVSHIIGFLLQSDSESVVIAQEWLPDIPSLKNVIAIPRAMISAEVIISQAPDWPIDEK